MDIDMRSPSFRTPQSGKTKRARSPPSPTPYDRPNKRISLGVIPANPFPQALPSPLVSAPLAMRDRQVSEDWVNRTRSLSIDNIKSTEDQSTNLLPVVEFSVNQDENMNMEYNEPMATSRSLDISSTSSFPMHNGLSSYPSSSNSLSSAFTTSDTSSLFSQQIPSSTSLHSYPSPITSSDTLSFPSPQTSNFSSPAQTPAPSFDRPTFEQMPTTSTQAAFKKPRFTMGPRADCEKCRFGVPGHWAHFD